MRNFAVREVLVFVRENIWVEFLFYFLGVFFWRRRMGMCG